MNPLATFHWFPNSSAGVGGPSHSGTSEFPAYLGTVPFHIADFTLTRLNPVALKELDATESAETAADRINPIAEQTRLIQLTNLMIVQVLGKLQPDDLARTRQTCKTLYIHSNQNDAVQNSLRTVLPNLQLRHPCMFSFSEQFRIICHYIYPNINHYRRSTTQMQMVWPSDLHMQMEERLKDRIRDTFIMHDNQVNYDKLITTQEQALNGV
jgi:hypothetical protein